MIIAILLGIGLVGAVTLIHVASLRASAVWLASTNWPASATIGGAVYAAFGAHMIGAALYAIGFWLGGEVWGIGSFAKAPSMNPMDYFYFSLVNMTTLGLGDIYPTGHLRFLAGIEALNGFLLISCSASFLFLTIRTGAATAFVSTDNE